MLNGKTIGLTSGLISRFGRTLYDANVLQSLSDSLLHVCVSGVGFV